MTKFVEVISTVGHKIDVLCGDEYLFPLQVALGAVGAILATPNIIPRILVGLFRRAASGDLDGARQSHAKLIPFINDLFCEPNPAPLKEALAMVGMDVGIPLLPLMPVSEGTKARLEATVPGVFEAEKSFRQA
jgi:4-hydroxy-tetrahydrodipicolinate synthase